MLAVVCSISMIAVICGFEWRLWALRVEMYSELSRNAKFAIRFSELEARTHDLLSERISVLEARVDIFAGEREPPPDSGPSKHQ